MDSTDSAGEELQVGQSELIELEEQGWRALSSSSEAAAEFYQRVLDDTVVMLLPGGMVLDDRAAIVQSMSGQPWSSFELQDPRVIQPTADTALVTYGVVAQREGTLEYSALMSSMYVRRPNGCRRAFDKLRPHRRASASAVSHP